jgi:hypothetical protein
MLLAQFTETYKMGTSSTDVPNGYTKSISFINMLYFFLSKMKVKGCSRVSQTHNIRVKTVNGFTEDATWIRLNIWKWVSTEMLLMRRSGWWPTRNYWWPHFRIAYLNSTLLWSIYIQSPANTTVVFSKLCSKVKPWRTNVTEKK